MSAEKSVDTHRDLTDVCQIRDAYARYAFAYDQGLADEFAALFTEDGVFEIAGGPVIGGRESLAGMVSAAAARPARTLHVVSNVLVTITGGTAAGQAYVVLLAVHGGALRVVTAGTYADSFVCTPDGWLLSRRRFEPAAGPNPLGVPVTGASVGTQD